MLKHLAIIAVALVMVLSAVSAVSSADGQTSAGATNVGNYTMSENMTSHAVDNVSFVHDHFSAQIASTVNASGRNLTGNMLSGYQPDNVKSFYNLTMFSGGSENTLFFATGSLSGVHASITVNFTSAVSQFNLTNAQKTYLQNHTSSLLSSFLANKVFSFSINGTNFIVFSNQQGVLSNNNKTMTFKASNPIVGAANTFVGISSTSALKDTLEKELKDKTDNPLTYNNVTGQVSGKYVSFNFNDTSGVISGYGSNVSGSTIFTSIQASGNGTIGTNVPNPAFVSSQPIVVGSVFYYGNNTVVYQMHNDPSLVSSMFLSNGTLNFSVASGINVTAYRPTNIDIEHEGLNSTNINYTGVNLGDQFDMGASSTVVFLHNSTFRASLFVHGANVAYSNGTISVSTNKIAKVSFVAPPGLQNLKKDVRDAIQNAIQHNRLAALVVLGAPGNGSSNLTVSYNGSLQITVENVAVNKVTVRVDSLHHEGTNFAVFVPNGVISNSSKISLTFDNKTVTLSSSMNGVLNATSSVAATFYYITVANGTLVVIHVPHFSVHTIEISTASTSNGTSGLPGLPGYDGFYAIAGILVVLAVISGVVISRRRK